MNLPHRVTVTAEDFRSAFRSGHYNTFWLSGGIDKLPDPLAEEIREAVNRGDSLLIDGMHDERNKVLDEVVGVQVIDTLPVDARVITTEPAAQIDSAGTQAMWDFSLGIEQSQDLTLSWWLSGLTGSYTLDTLVNTRQDGQAKPYGSYPLTLTVASALDQQATDDLIAQLKVLTFSSNKDRQARDKAVKSLQDALVQTSSGNYDGAIDSLIEAVNRLNAIKSQDTSPYRLGLDRWLQGLEQQWQPAPLPDKPHKKQIRAGWHDHSPGR